MIENLFSQSHIRLRLIREALELNRKDFSEILKVNYRTYNEWEKKEIIPSMNAQKRMISIGINPHYLFGDDSPTINGYTFENVKNNIQKREN